MKILNRTDFVSSPVFRNGYLCYNRISLILITDWYCNFHKGYFCIHYVIFLDFDNIYDICQLRLFLIMFCHSK